MLGLEADADYIEGSDCMRVLDPRDSRNGNGWLPKREVKTLPNVADSIFAMTDMSMSCCVAATAIRL
jgi:hypothetical protein